MGEVVITSFLVKFGMAVLGLALLMGALRVFDLLAEIKFREVFDIIELHAQAAALYLGLRFLGVCLVLAAALL